MTDLKEFPRSIPKCDLEKWFLKLKMLEENKRVVELAKRIKMLSKSGKSQIKHVESKLMSYTSQQIKENPVLWCLCEYVLEHNAKPPGSTGDYCYGIEVINRSAPLEEMKFMMEIRHCSPANCFGKECNYTKMIMETKDFLMSPRGNPYDIFSTFDFVRKFQEDRVKIYPNMANFLIGDLPLGVDNLGRMCINMWDGAYYNFNSIYKSLVDLFPSEVVKLIFTYLRINKAY